MGRPVQFKLRGAVFRLHVIAYNLVRLATYSSRRWQRNEQRKIEISGSQIKEWNLHAPQRARMNSA